MPEQEVGVVMKFFAKPSVAAIQVTGGSIKKGDLKVVGKTDPVPFITAFVSEAMSADKQKQVLDLLLSLKSNAALLKAMESKQGFTPVEVSEPTKLKSSAVGEWPDWRGPGRDGHVPELPARLRR